MQKNYQVSAAVTISELSGESLMEKQLGNNRLVSESSGTFHAVLENQDPE